MSQTFEELPYYLPDAECPFFLNSVSLNLLTYAKQTNHHETKKQRKETENVINSDLTLGLKKKEGTWQTKQRHWQKERDWKNGFGQWETLNLLLFHVSLTCKLTHTSRAAHIAVKDKGQRSRASFWLGFGEKQKEGEQQQLLVVVVGVGQSQLQRHTDGSLWKERITCARLLSCHILIPGRALWEPTLPPHPHPTRLVLHPGHSALPPSAFPPLCCCSQVRTHKHFHQSHPNNWPASCLSRTPGGVGRMWVSSVMSCWSLCLKCALHFYCYLREKKTQKKERNLLFKIFIFEGWLCWRSESRDLVAVLY